MKSTSFNVIIENINIIGLAFFVSLVIGGIVTGLYVWIIRKIFKVGKPEDQKRYPRISPWLNGLVERLFFTFVCGFDISGAASAMIGWIAIKIASNWQQKKEGESDLERRRRLSIIFSSLQGSLISMIFSIIGGLILRIAIS